MVNNKRREQLREAVLNKDPTGIANALNIPNISSNEKKNVSSTFKSSKNNNNSLMIADSIDANGNSVNWSGVFNSWSDAEVAVQRGDINSLYESQSSLHSSLNNIFGSSSGNWLVPALHTACRNTHKIAVLADSDGSKKSTNGTNDHSKLQSAITLLQDSFSKCLNDRKEFKPDAPLNEEGSKKAGVLFIVNHLFSMYFRLNTLRLCRNLVLPVEKQKLHLLEGMGLQVTYRYYVGRLNMYEDQYDSAEMNLTFAFLHCPKYARRNKQRILNYLLPVKLLRGRLPTMHLLEKYSLSPFVPLVSSIRTGDLKTFHVALNQYQDLFIRQGTYLLLEKCKILCYRNLFKRVHYVINKKTQIPLALIVKTLTFLHLDADLDEVECILANLIFRGYIKGYISHSKRILVLSKKDAFPVSAVVPK